MEKRPRYYRRTPSGDTFFKDEQAFLGFLRDQPGHVFEVGCEMLNTEEQAHREKYLHTPPRPGLVKMVNDDLASDRLTDVDGLA